MTKTIIAAAGLAAGLACFGMASASHAGVPAEFFNEFDWAPSSPSPGPTNFEIVFAGNVTCQIPKQNAHDGSTNPFKHPKPITTTYDPVSNTTTVKYSGQALAPGQRYHFGLNQGFAPTPPLVVVSKMWTYDQSAPSPLPIVNVTPPGPVPPTGPVKYAIVYLEAAFQPGGQTYGSWYEMPYVPPAGKIAAETTQPVFTFTNYGPQPLYISNAGIQFNLPVPTAAGCKTNPTCSTNTIMLHNLDFGLTPPPGQPGSRFVPIAAPPAATLTSTKVVAPVTACAVATK